MPVPLFPLVELKQIRKQFQPSGVVAVDGADYSILPGEIHALIGENGSGKSTLMHILSGLVPADSGEIAVGGTQVILKSPADSLLLGIGMIHQNIPVLPELTVFENATLGMPYFLRPHKPAARFAVICEQYDLPLQADDVLKQIPPFRRILTALVTLLMRDQRLFIFDEPGTALAPREMQKLFFIMNTLTSQGKSVVLITHKLNDVFAAAQQVSVMRHGRIVASSAVESTDKSELTRYMIGFDDRTRDRESGNPSAPVKGPIFEIKNLSTGGSSPLHHIDLQVFPGEIHGVTGIRENGVGQLEDVCVGNTEVKNGSLFFGGNNIGKKQIRDLNIGYVPSDRLAQGASVDSTVAENLILHSRTDLGRFGLLFPGTVKKGARKIGALLGIPPNLDIELSRLSGGNMQRVILARELAFARELLIISEPFWGLDLRNREMLSQILHERKAKGAGTLFFCSDIDDVLELSTTITVLFNGTIAATLPNKNIHRSVLGDYMLSGKRAE